MANSWQQAKQKQTEQKRLALVGDLYQEMIAKMRDEVIGLKNQVIETFLKKELGVEIIIDTTEIVKRGYTAQAEDGSEVFHWDNHPRIYFSPIDTKEVDGVLRPILYYQMIPIVAQTETQELREGCPMDGDCREVGAVGPTCSERGEDPCTTQE